MKGNVDRATGDSDLADLASLGAVCTIVLASAVVALSTMVTPPSVMRRAS